ncbi:hypothetical protein GFK02_23080, partial [Salmonella enterica subsp. enterica serovar Enteritidis]|nr:hypothetical protein [Salmonella enterica subsp. enterica serovar Enteritidis]
MGFNIIDASQLTGKRLHIHNLCRLALLFIIISASTGAIDHGIAGKIDVTAHATAEAVTNASSE